MDTNIKTAMIDSFSTEVNSLVDTNMNAKKFTSSNQTITAGGLITVAHGLGVVPDLIDFELYCAVADDGWGVGDVIKASLNATTTASSRASALYTDSVNVYMRVSASSNSFLITNKSTGSATTITNANWRVIIKARV